MQNRRVSGHLAEELTMCHSYSIKSRRRTSPYLLTGHSQLHLGNRTSGRVLNFSFFFGNPFLLTLCIARSQLRDSYRLTYRPMISNNYEQRNPIWYAITCVTALSEPQFFFQKTSTFATGIMTPNQAINNPSLPLPNVHL